MCARPRRAAGVPASRACPPRMETRCPAGKPRRRLCPPEVTMRGAPPSPAVLPPENHMEATPRRRSVQPNRGAAVGRGLSARPPVQVSSAASYASPVPGRTTKEGSGFVVAKPVKARASRIRAPRDAVVRPASGDIRAPAAHLRSRPESPDRRWSRECGMRCRRRSSACCRAGSCRSASWAAGPRWSPA